MGAWGVLAFHNDDACDWASDLEITDDLSLVESAFEAVESVSDYIEAPEAMKALAACEVLARLTGQPAYTDSYTQKVDEWVASHRMVPPTALRKRAKTVVDRILGENSELKKLWSESSENGNWLASVEDLRRRV